MAQHLIEKAAYLFDNKKPFVLYRKPNEDQLHLIAQHNAVLHLVDDYSESGFLLAPFQYDLTPFIIVADEWESAPFRPYEKEQFSSTVAMLENEAAKLIHINLVAKAKEEIEKGIIDKVVVSRRISTPYNTIPFKAFQYLLSQYTNAFTYLWYHPDLGCWMGASPELLLSMQEDRLLTYSLAGTMPYSEGEQPAWELKEKEEQQLVTDYILQQLSELGLQPEASSAQSSKAGKLWHLRSEIKVQGKNVDLSRILDVLHPTPAVCGIPKSTAIRFIEQHENYDRKFYTGFLGELNVEDGRSCNLFVNLRCMEWDDQLAHIYVGGGITAKSTPEAEWMETQYKSLTILNALFNSDK